MAFDSLHRLDHHFRLALRAPAEAAAEKRGVHAHLRRVHAQLTPPRHRGRATASACRATDRSRRHRTSARQLSGSMGECAR